MINQVDIFLFILTIITTALFTAFVRKILLLADISDNPIISEHRSKTGTPTMGGFGILLGMLLLTLLTINMNANSYLIVTTLMMIVGGFFGAFDDLIGFKIKEYQKVVLNTGTTNLQIGKLNLGPGEEARITSDKAKKDYKLLIAENKIKLVDEIPIKNEESELQKIGVQILVSVFLLLTGLVSSTIWGFDLGLFMIPLVIFAVVGSINSVNLIDGMDGLAAGIIGIASLASALYASVMVGSVSALPFIIMSGASFGFLILNSYPAKIFMGDIGSFALGTGYITAALIGDTFIFSVILLSVPIVSILISLLHRAHIIKLPIEPLHHALNYYGMSEQKIIILYWGVTLIVAIIALLIFGII